MNRVKNKKYRVYILFFIYIVFICVDFYAQEIRPFKLPQLTADAPTSLFDYTVLDSNVEFFVDGYWESTLTGSFSLQFGSGSALEVNFNPLIFSQKVDFSTWVFIDNTWYFEANFADGFARNTLAAGYVSDERIVRHVRAGNSLIVFPNTYALGKIGGGKTIAPGVMASFAGDTWRADALVRYDTVQLMEKNYFGMNEVSDSDIAVGSYEKGKWFILPSDAEGNAGDIVQTIAGVFVQDATGSFHRLTPAEYVINPVENIVILASPCLNEVLVTFSAPKSIVENTVRNFINNTQRFFDSSDAASITLSDYMPNSSSAPWVIEHEGVPALLLRKNGFFSPFELASRYKAHASADNFSLVYGETGLTVENYGVSSVTDSVLFPDNAQFQSLWAEVYEKNSNMSFSYQHPEKRFPLAAIYPWGYIPNNAGIIPSSDVVLRSRTFTPIQRFDIGGNAVNGTITVYRDGIIDTNFLFDENIGVVTLNRSASPFEHIRITWMNATENQTNGSFVYACGFQWDFAEKWKADIVLGTRWGISGGIDSFISQSGFSSESFHNPGIVEVAARVAYTSGESIAGALTMQNTASFSMNIVDTSGFYQIDGMNADENSETKFDHVFNWDTTTSSWLSAVTDMGNAASALASAQQFSLSVRDIAGIISYEGHINPDYDVFLQLNVNTNEYGINDSFVEWKLENTHEVLITEKGDGWNVVTITLSDAVRSRFAQGYTGMRFRIVKKTPAALNTGTLRTQAYEIIGVSFASVNARAVEIRDPAVPPLTSTPYASIIERFNPKRFNSVLEITASNVQPFSVSKYIPPVPLSSYNKFDFFVYVPNSTVIHEAITVLFDTRTQAGIIPVLSLVLPISLGREQWHHITVDLNSGEVFIDEVSAGHAVIFKKNSAPTQISFSGLLNEGGKIYIDELYLNNVNPQYALENTVTATWEKNGSVLSYNDFPIFADPSVTVSGTVHVPLAAEKEGAVVQFAGNTQGKLSIAMVDVKGFFSRTLGEKSIFSTAGHSISTPSSFPLQLTESFTVLNSGVSAQKINTITIPFVYVSFQGNTTPLADSQKIEAKADVTISIKSFVYEFALKTDAAQLVPYVEGDIDIENKSYGSQWLDMWGVLFSDGDKNANSRTLSALIKNSLAIPFGQLKPLIQLELKSNYEAGNTVTFKDTTSFLFSIPFAIAFNHFTVSWEKRSASSMPVSVGGNYFDDVRSYQKSLGTQVWLWTEFPIADLISQELPHTIASQIKNGSSLFYTGIYSLNWNKPLSSTITDLFIPTDVHIQFAREILTAGQDISDLYRLTGKVRLSALNQFGAYSKNRWFKWFEQDESTQAYSFTVKFAPDYFDWNITSYHSLSIFFTNINIVKIENSFFYQKNGQWKTQAALSWNRTDSSSFIGELYLFFLKDDKKDAAQKNITTVRSDSIKAAYGKEFFDAYEIEYDHTLKVTFSKIFTCSISVGSMLSYKKNKPFLLQNRVSIAGKLQY